MVTYAKSGTVLSADSRPLGVEEMDRQGRCILTNHGSFVVFNVYIPLGSGSGKGLTTKLKFLRALKNAMEGQRLKGKKVILVGDLNIAHTVKDRHWTFRNVCVEKVLVEVEANRNCEDRVGGGEGTHTLPKWKVQLFQHWKKLQNALSTIEAVSTTTTNVSNGKTYDRYRARVTLANDRKVFLGKHEDTKNECLGYYYFKARTYTDEHEHGDEGDEVDEKVPTEKVARAQNVISIMILADLMTKIANVEWDTATLRTISTSFESIHTRSPTIDWLNDVLESQDMMDPFRHVHPHAAHRFTCWNQMTNRRYDNMGARIDYTLVDKTLVHFVDNDESARGKLRSCFYDGDDKSEEAALHAATASGNFVGAGYEGGGIACASTKALETQFGNNGDGKDGNSGGAHTGIIYTAPQYSDHVGVSLLLNEQFDETYCSRPMTLDLKDGATKRAQPHKMQKSISSFFASASTSVSALTTSSTAAKRKGSSSKSFSVTSKEAAKKRKGGSLLNHFGASNASTTSSSAKATIERRECSSTLAPKSKSKFKSKAKAKAKPDPKPLVNCFFAKPTTKKQKDEEELAISEV